LQCTAIAIPTAAQVWQLATDFVFRHYYHFMHQDESSFFFIDVKKHSEGLSKKKRKNPKFDLAPKEGGETPSRISKL